LGYFNKILTGTVLVVLLMFMPLNVFAQIDKPPTPQHFSVHYYDSEIVVTIKNIDFDLPRGYDIHYNIRTRALHDDGSYSWREVFGNSDAPVQGPSEYTTISLYANFYGGADDRVTLEVQSLVCHYKIVEKSVYPPPFDDPVPVTVTIADSKSDWSSPQILSLDKNGASGVPTSVLPDPTQTTVPSTQNPQYTQNPTASSNPEDNPLTSLINSNWEKLALLAMAAIIVVLAAGLVLLWRKVGNIDRKYSQNRGT
jgi:hypothetical protein